MKTRGTFTIFKFGIKFLIVPSYFLKVHVLDQDVGPKGPQEQEWLTSIFRGFPNILTSMTLNISIMKKASLTTFATSEMC